MFRTIATRKARLGLEPLEGREVPAFVYALTASGRLQTFDTSNPNVMLGAVSVTGLSSPDERITDIDVRPGSGGLYGRSSSGFVYLINPLTGSSIRIGSAVAAAASAGFDFDPLTNQIRFVNNSGGNFAIDPQTGSLAAISTMVTYPSDDPLTGAVPHFSSLAFTNSVPFASFTQLFAIDHAANTLATAIGDPSNGVFRTVGSLGVDVTNATGLEIDPSSGAAFISFQRNGDSFSSFGVIDLNTGFVTDFGTLGNMNRVVLDIAVPRNLVDAGIVASQAAGQLAVQQTGLGTITSNPLVSVPGVAQIFTPPTSPLTSVVPLSPTLVQPLGVGLVSPLAVQPVNSFVTPTPLPVFTDPLVNLGVSNTFGTTLNGISPISPVNAFGTDNTFGLGSSASMFSTNFIPPSVFA